MSSADLASAIIVCGGVWLILFVAYIYLNAIFNGRNNNA